VTTFRRLLAATIVDPLLWDVAKRIPLRRRLGEFRAAMEHSRREQKHRLERRLRDLLLHAVEHVPFYREAAGASCAEIAGDPLGALQAFPVVEKDDLRRRGKTLICEMGRRTFSNASGGSTGEPVHFLQDSVFMTAAIAAKWMAFELAGISRGDSIVRVWGARRDFRTHRYPLLRSVRDRIDNRVVLDAFRMGTEQLEAYSRLLSSRTFDCVEGYADALFELALYAEAHGVPFKRPRAVVTSATTLLPHMRREIERTFRARVFERYGAREVGDVAAECVQHEGMHILEDTNYVEVVDQDARPVGVGEEGDVLVTNLWNYTMPLIRYRLGDRAVLGRRQCDCGLPYPTLRRVAGRTSECLRAADGSVLSAASVAQLIGVVWGRGAIHRFQVVQEASDRVVVRVVPQGERTELPRSVGDAIVEALREALGERTTVEIVVQRELQPGPTGKIPYVVSRIEEG